MSHVHDTGVHQLGRRRPATACFFVLTLLACGAESPREPSSGDPEAAAPVSGDSAPGAVAGPDSLPPSPPSTWAYICPDGLRFPVHYRADAVTITLPDRELTLSRSSGEPPATYQSDEALFRHRAGRATLEAAGEVHEACEGAEASSPEEAARLLGFDFRGVGQEPGWLVDVDLDRQVRWIGSYGEVRFATPPPDTVEVSEDSVIWRVVTDEHELTVEVRSRPCRDAMSGRPFSHSVRVRVDGEELTGCGRWLTSG